jgi:hypothetical protein
VVVEVVEVESISIQIKTYSDSLGMILHVLHTTQSSRGMGTAL